MIGRFSVHTREEERTFELGAEDDGRRVVQNESGVKFEVVVLAGGERPVLSVEGRVISLVSTADGWFSPKTRETFRVEAAGRARRGVRKEENSGAGASVRSPMPGRVVRVLVAEGDAVSAGAGIVVIEAMKMENELVAERAGTVKRVAVLAGAAVERDELLVEITGNG
jgi:biotin carboxyl carrier protein